MRYAALFAAMLCMLLMAGPLSARNGRQFGAALTLSCCHAGGTETTLHVFRSGGGSNSESGLTAGPNGVLYGTTVNGGSNLAGVVFELKPFGHGYKETVIDSFLQPQDGAWPHAGVIRDPAGVLYGTTENGGARNYGTVYALSPTSGGFKESIIYNFGNAPGDGGFPDGGLLLDASGNLYGTTSSGGTSKNCFNGCGTVFKLTRSQS